MERELKIKTEFLKLIVYLGYDYDGFDTVDSLKALIDDLVGYAKSALGKDDKLQVYSAADGKKLNILREEIK